MRTLALTALALGLAGLAGGASAADKKEADPTGTWTWTLPIKGENRDFTAKLEAKDGKVTGTVQGGRKAANISDGTFKKGVLTFTVVREIKELKLATRYSGRVKGDTIKGIVQSTIKGKTFKAAWNAKREKKAKD